MFRDENLTVVISSEDRRATERKPATVATDKLLAEQKEKQVVPNKNILSSLNKIRNVRILMMKDDHNKKSQYKVPRQTVLKKRYMLIRLSINLIIIFSDDGSTENVMLLSTRI